MSHPVIAEEYRGDVLENIHQGIYCIIDEDKQVIHQKGNVNHPTLYRSAMKPLQAIPFFTTDIQSKYQLSSEEVALLTASQRGEIYHEEALTRLIDKLNFEEDMLVCGSSYPLNEEPKMEYILEGKEKRKLMHNCAGKHLGFLAYAREKGYETKGYTDYDHPLQQEIRQYISLLSETPIEEMRTGVDGCGAPIYAVPLKNMAISYLKYAKPELIEDEKIRKAVINIGHIMNENPNIVASHDFVCSVLLDDSNIIAKGGAQGVYCLSLREEKLSIALKVLSGTELLWPLIVAELLEKINYKNKETIQRLLELRTDKITNDAGKVIGETKVLL